MTMRSTCDLVKRLRLLMADTSVVPQALDVYIVPTNDAHSSEYVAKVDKRREYISGFTGSAGTAYITKTTAAVFVDGRYHTQADQEVDQSCWEIKKEGLPGVPTQSNWLLEQLPASGGGAVGIDPRLYTFSSARPLKDKLAEFGHSLVPVDRNLVDVLWGDTQPTRPATDLFILPDSVTGLTWPEKVKKVVEALKATDLRAECLLLPALDDVAWLLNLRAIDIPHNPVFFAYVIVRGPLTPSDKPELTLFIEQKRVVNRAVRTHLGLDPANLAVTTGEKDGVSIRIMGYNRVADELRTLSEYAAVKRIVMSNSASFWLVGAVPEAKRAMVDATPVAVLKVVKNQAEMTGMHRAHLLDGIALAETFNWIEEQLAAKKTVRELDVVTKLDTVKTQLFGAEFLTSSFETIAGSGPNAAIIHYKPEPSTNRELKQNEVFLLDSGSQFTSGGTTDVTRTIWPSKLTPPARVRDCFTLVVKGHIQLGAAVFPEGIFGSRLDTLARSPLWEYGLDYMHGTGHGVGALLNVHEGPIGISSRWRPGEPALVENHILSNEPGYYEPLQKKEAQGTASGNKTPSPSTSPARTTQPTGQPEEKRALTPRKSPPQTIDLRSSPVKAAEVKAAEPEKKSPEKPKEAQAAQVSPTKAAASPSKEDVTGFGIRIESLVRVAKTKVQTPRAGEKNMLTFETITLSPIDTRLIEPRLLTAKQLKWLNDYHSLVRQKVEPELASRGLEAARRWLIERTQPIASK